jgi:hypothetical protein
MKLPVIIKSLLFITVLSFSGNAIWLYEIAVIIGWHSLSWLYIPLYSPFLIALLPALAFITGYSFYTNKSKLQWFIIVLLLYVVNLSFFFIGKDFCYASFSRFGWLWVSIPFGITIGLLIFLLFGSCYWLIAHKLIAPLNRKFFLVIAGICLLSIPISLGTFLLIPGFANGGSFIDCIKMGYPTFWITFLLGISGMLALKQSKIAR